MKKKKTLVIILGIVTALATTFLILLLLTGKINITKENKEVIIEDDSEKTIDVIDEDEDVLKKYRETYDANKAKNEDYIGEIFFESGLINYPVVQGETNDTYLRMNWETFAYDEEGSIFLDYRNTLADQNLIIYGHYVYADETHKFSPLTQLIYKENYEANKKLTLVLEHEIRTYEVAVVYHCQLVKEDEYYVTREDMQYYHTNYEEEYFNTYKESITKNSFYDTDVDFEFNDYFLTLQTCVRNRDDLRLIVFCKQVGVQSY